MKTHVVEVDSSLIEYMARVSHAESLGYEICYPYEKIGSKEPRWFFNGGYYSFDQLPVPPVVWETCEGYRKLLAAVEHDEKTSAAMHDYRKKLMWVLARAEHYAQKTGLSPYAILDAWEKDRDYWYMNYYQDANQPLIEDGKVRVFQTVEDLRKSVDGQGFRCPSCGGVSKSPYECDTGLEMSPGKVCDWKSYGLFGHLGKGISVFVVEKLKVQSLFMPVAWEKQDDKAS